MVYNDTHGMLAVTQPSFTSLAPGYGVRRVNMLELRVGKKNIASAGSGEIIFGPLQLNIYH